MAKKPTEATRRLRAEEVEYLALEGGGGKGFAYLGALQLLDQHGILSRIKGVAGTSAGAITALMISLGMTASDITHAVDTIDFTSFYDPPQPRLIPVPTSDPRQDGRYEPRSDTIQETTKLVSNANPTSLIKLADDLQSSAEKIGPGHLPGWIVWAGIAPLLNAVSASVSTGQQLLGRLSTSVADPPVDQLVKYWQAYFGYLERDMGMFSGYAARQYFDNLIATRAAKIMNDDPLKYRNLPFIVHKKIFGRELLVCGANLSTGRTVLFSPRHEHTPYFPVADAVRISMSLPLIYKPYVIKNHVPGWPECGTYVDGGLWNNIPLREIEPLLSAGPGAGALLVGAPGSSDGSSIAQRWPAKTLALRLEIVPPSPVTTALDVMTAMLQGVIGSGETQALKDLEYMSIVLDTQDLSLLKFQPAADIRARVLKRSRRQVSGYFGWPIATTDKDPDDDRRLAAAAAKSICDPP